MGKSRFWVGRGAPSGATSRNSGSMVPLGPGTRPDGRVAALQGQPRPTQGKALWCQGGDFRPPPQCATSLPSPRSAQRSRPTCRADAQEPLRSARDPAQLWLGPKTQKRGVVPSVGIRSFAPKVLVGAEGPPPVAACWPQGTPWGPPGGWLAWGEQQATPVWPCGPGGARSLSARTLRATYQVAPMHGQTVRDPGFGCPWA